MLLTAFFSAAALTGAPASAPAVFNDSTEGPWGSTEGVTLKRMRVLPDSQSRTGGHRGAFEASWLYSYCSTSSHSSLKLGQIRSMSSSKPQELLSLGFYLSF
jgi:hypothetical protein